MGLPKRVLGTDEHVVWHMRTHGKDLFLPGLTVVLLGVLTWVALVYVPQDWMGVGKWVLGILVAAGLLWGAIIPFLHWITATYTLTTRRVITRRGIFNKSGHDVPLSRINNVTYDRSLLDRIFRCGTLVLTTAAEEPLTLPDVPHVERVHVVMTELLFGDVAAAIDAAHHHE